MSEKSEASAQKRQRQGTDADVESLLREVEKYKNMNAILDQQSHDQDEEIEDLKKTLKITKQQLDIGLIENERLSVYVKELIETQKTFVEQIRNVQETLQIVLTNQNKNENTLESIKNTCSKQTEKIKTQFQQQQKQQKTQQQQIQQQIKQQLQKQTNE